MLYCGSETKKQREINDGDIEDPEAKAECRVERASVPELLEEGYGVLNYNSYYLYYVPSINNYNKSDNDYMIDDLLQNWDVSKWDSDCCIIMG